MGRSVEVLGLVTKVVFGTKFSLLPAIDTSSQYCMEIIGSIGTAVGISFAAP